MNPTDHRDLIRDTTFETGRRMVLVERLQHYLSRYHGALLAVMLGVLYVVLQANPGDLMSRFLFVGHLGLFILWQPVIEQQRQLSWGTAGIMLVALVWATYLLDAWLLALWIVLLAGFVGGKVLLAGSSRLRHVYLLTLAFLVIGLLVFAIPGAVPGALTTEPIRWIGRVAMLSLMAAIVILANGPSPAGKSEVLDLVNSVLVVLLLGVLALGALSMMLLFQMDYAAALVQTLFVLAGFLAVLGWLWSPHFGFSGLQTSFSRYLLSIGLPAQDWLQALADLTQRQTDPVAFVEEACISLTRQITWLRGITWRVSGPVAHARAGIVGMATGEQRTFRHADLEICVFTRYVLPPTIVVHLNLLTQLLAEFYGDKQRAQRLRELSYLRAVHETGARLTHDVKNLLQSLQTLIYAAEHAPEGQSAAVRSLIQRQLPAISTRLATTLDRLRAPSELAPAAKTPADRWWLDVQARYTADAWVGFQADALDGSESIPETLFNAVLDNLLANAQTKRAAEPALRALVSLQKAPAGQHGLVLQVMDCGSMVPRDVAAHLIERPVDSRNGLGIGLYQIGRLAQDYGYELKLAENRMACVCFRLSPLPD